MDRSQFKEIPPKPGAYLFKDVFGKVIYVGKARNLKNRVSSYFQKEIVLGDKTAQLVKNIKTIDYIMVESEIEALLLEANLIKKYRPKYNVELKDDKKYPYIKITHENFSRVFLARRVKDDRALYFGPYPDGTSVRKILGLIRHIFPFCTHKKSYRSCLFIHLGLCPGPGISINEKDYKRTIKLIINFLKGKKTAVLKKLQREMEEAAFGQDYRKAALIKRQIWAIENITQEVKSPFEYLKNPNLVKDLAREKLKELTIFLGLSKVPKKIECYDISNISGTDATGSMAVAIDGQSASSMYKRFRIKRIPGSNDTAMIEEILTRRFKHKEWELPDLVVVDGGLAQVNAASKIIHSFRLNISVVGLAKRLEEVYFANNKSPLATNKNPKAKFILQEIRNEAHRFAKAYHLHLRSKRQVR